MENQQQPREAPQRDNARKFGRVVLILIGLALIATIILVKTTRTGPKGAEAFFAKGIEQRSAGYHLRALEEFRVATQLDPENAPYHEAAALAAWEIPGRRVEALNAAEQAWSHGTRTADLLRIRVHQFLPPDAAGPSASDTDIDTARHWFEELPPHAQNEELRGELLSLLGRHEEARQIWDDLMQTAPRPTVVARIANGYLDNKKFAEAETFLNTQREEGRLDEEGYRMLVNLRLDRNGVNQLLELYEEAKERDYYDETLKLEHALAQIIALLPAGALPILEDMIELSPDKQIDDLHFHARLFLGLLYLEYRNRDGIEKLLQITDQGKRIVLARNERLYHGALLALLNDEHTAALTSLEEVARTIPGQPAVEWLLAQEMARLDRHAEALTHLRAIPGMFAQSSQVLARRALSLHETGNDKEALTLLRRIHSRGAMTLATAKLYQDLSETE